MRQKLKLYVQSIEHYDDSYRGQVACIMRVADDYTPLHFKAIFPKEIEKYTKLFAVGSEFELQPIERTE